MTFCDRMNIMKRLVFDYVEYITWNRFNLIKHAQYIVPSPTELFSEQPVLTASANLTFSRTCYPIARHVSPRILSSCTGNNLDQILLTIVSLDRNVSINHTVQQFDPSQIHFFGVFTST